MKKYLLLALIAATLSGCAMVPSNLGYAVIEVEKEGVAATDATSRRIGKACGVNVLGIVATGDLSIEKAKRLGGIQRVATVDKEVTSILGVFSKVCTVVTGE